MAPIAERSAFHSSLSNHPNRHGRVRKLDAEGRKRRGGPAEVEAREHKSASSTATRAQLTAPDPKIPRRGRQIMRHRSTDSAWARRPGRRRLHHGLGELTAPGVVFAPRLHRFRLAPMSETNALNICKIMDHAMRVVGAPLIGLNDSGGARHLREASRRSLATRIFFCVTPGQRRRYIQSKYSAVMGPARAARLFLPRLNDFIFMTRDTSYLQSAWP